MALRPSESDLTSDQVPLRGTFAVHSRYLRTQCPSVFHRPVFFQVTGPLKLFVLLRSRK